MSPFFKTFLAILSMVVVTLVVVFFTHPHYRPQTGLEMAVYAVIGLAAILLATVIVSVFFVIRWVDRSDEMEQRGRP